MAINMNTETLNEGPNPTNEWIESVLKTSALFKLVEVRRMKHAGESFAIVPEITVAEVGETELKPVNDKPITSLIAKPITLAGIVSVSKQLLNDKPGLMAEVAKKGTAAIAYATDVRAAGVVGVSEQNFGQLRNTTNKVTLSAKADIFRAYGLLAATGSAPNGWLMDTAFYAEVAGAVNEFGAPKYNIQGDINSGTIEGVKYVTYVGTTGEAFLGDFANKAKAGIVYDVDININPYGGTGEGADYRNSFQRNLVDVRIEQAVAFNAILDAFVHVTLPNSGLEEGEGLPDGQA